jgi:hypothetical protein
MQVKKNYCTNCKYNYLTETLYDKHRVGRFEITTDAGVVIPSERRCMTEAEMRKKGWECTELEVKDLGMALTWTDQGQLEKREKTAERMRERFR